MTDFEASRLAHTLKDHGQHPSLMHVLEDVQSRYRYLPQDAMILVSERLGVPLSQVYSVATFYLLIYLFCKIFLRNVELFTGFFYYFAIVLYYLKCNIFFRAFLFLWSER